MTQALEAPPAAESLYQPTQAGLIFPQAPKFATLAEERLHRKIRLAAACRAFASWGFDYGFAGHLTVRDPETPELYWTNPMCVHFRDVTLSSLILVDHSGMVRQGDYAVNRAGFVLHAAVHAANPQIVAMCHAHTTYGAAWCSLGRSLDPITQDACAFFENQIVVRESAGAVTVEARAGHSVAECVGDNRAILHQNHGLMTTSRHSIDDAAWWFMALERCCQVQLQVESSGSRPVTIPSEAARYSRTHVGSDYIGWLHFQPVYSHIAKTQPEIFN